MQRRSRRHSAHDFWALSTRRNPVRSSDNAETIGERCNLMAPRPCCRSDAVQEDERDAIARLDKRNVPARNGGDLEILRAVHRSLLCLASEPFAEQAGKALPMAFCSDTVIDQSSVDGESVLRPRVRFHFVGEARLIPAQPSTWPRGQAETRGRIRQSRRRHAPVRASATGADCRDDRWRAPRHESRQRPQLDPEMSGRRQRELPAEAITDAADARAAHGWMTRENYQQQAGVAHDLAIVDGRDQRHQPSALGWILECGCGGKWCEGPVR